MMAAATRSVGSQPPPLPQEPCLGPLAWRSGMPRVWPPRAQIRPVGQHGGVPWCSVPKTCEVLWSAHSQTSMVTYHGYRAPRTLFCQRPSEEWTYILDSGLRSLAPSLVCATGNASSLWSSRQPCWHTQSRQEQAQNARRL